MRVKGIGPSTLGGWGTRSRHCAGLLLCAGLGAVWHAPAQADCYANVYASRPGTTETPNFNLGMYNLSLTPTSSFVVEPQGATIGTVLVRATASLPPVTGSAFVPLGHCSVGAVEYFEAQLNAGSSTGLSGVYPTGVAGVGYRAIYPQSSPLGTSNDAYFAGNVNWVNPWPAGDGFIYFPEGYAVIEFVKTGAITGGTIPNGTLFAKTRMSVTIRNDPGDSLRLVYRLGAAIEFALPTCVFSSSLHQIALDPINSDYFSGVGSVVGTKDFSVSATCNNVEMVSPPQVSFVATSGEVTGMPGTVMSSNATGGASGVGIRLARRNLSNSFVPVEFDGTWTAMGTNRQVTGNEVAWDLDFQASYIQTETNVIPGNVSGLITVEIKYD